jgi:DNA-binding NtrC family response regulator
MSSSIRSTAHGSRSLCRGYERAILEHHLGKHRYNQRQTAKALGLTYDQLRHCLRKHGMMDKAAAAVAKVATDIIAGQGSAREEA